MTGNTPKPQPVPQPESDRYWEGLKNEEIWLQRSVATGKFQFYPRALAIEDADGNREIEWVQATGNAELFTFAIAHIAPHPGFAGDVPYITALVKLEEDVIVPTNIVGESPDRHAVETRIQTPRTRTHPPDVHPRVTGLLSVTSCRTRQAISNSRRFSILPKTYPAILSKGINESQRNGYVCNRT